MSLILIDGFDFYPSAVVARGWTIGTGVGLTSAGGGRFGVGRALVTPAGNASKPLPGNPFSSIIVGFARRTTDSTIARTVMEVRDGSSNLLCRIALNSSGRITVSDKNGTVKATGAITTFVQNAWNYIELKVVQNGASGTAEVHVDGVTEITATTGDYGTASTIQQIIFLGMGGGPVTQHEIDDLYVINPAVGGAPLNDFLGDVRVQTLYPTGDGAHTDFAPSRAGTHYDLVNETTGPDGDTTYVGSASSGARDSYAFGDVDGAATVLGLQTNLYARKDDTPVKQITPVIRQGSADYDGSTVTLSASYVYYSQMYELDPLGSAWTTANVNADEYGVKLV